MEKGSGKVPNHDVNRIATKHHQADKRTVPIRSDETCNEQNSGGEQDDEQIEVHLPESEGTVVEVKTDSCAVGENVRLGTSQELGRQSSSLENTLSPMPDEVQWVEDIDEISEQDKTEVPISEDVQTSLDKIDEKSYEYYTKNTCNTAKRLGLIITENLDYLDDIRKYEICCPGKTFCFHDFKSKMQHKREYLYTTIKQFFKLDTFEDFEKHRTIFDSVNPIVNHFNRTYSVYPIFSESSSESDSESESENEEMIGNEVLLNEENGEVGMQSNTSMQGNEEPRQGYGTNHLQNHQHGSENGNIVCHSTDESPSVSQTTATSVQISNNLMLVCPDTRSREESNLGHTLVTTESDTTVNSLVITSRSSWNNQLPDRTRVPLLPTLYSDLLDGNTAADWHRDNFEGLPILMANSVGHGFQEICTLDPGLMILLYQIGTNPRLLPIFSSSSHRIFNETLPVLLNLLCNKRFEELRQTWADTIQWRRNSFYGMEGNVIMPPFMRLLQCRCRSTCTNPTCPANNREFTMADIILSCPTEAFLDIAVLQDLIDRFEHGEMSACGELIYHTRPDDSNSPCTGMCRTERRIDTSVEVPPIIVLNFARSLLRWDQIGDLNGTVQIGSNRYYVGGLTFSGNQHFTARIYLPHSSIQLFYDNLQGIQVEQYSQRDYTYMSLLFLFRIE